jgi:hypothetical protein
MKGTSGEPERIEPRGALSGPQRLRPVPAILSLSLLQFHNADSAGFTISCGANRLVVLADFAILGEAA